MKLLEFLRYKYTSNGTDAKLECPFCSAAALEVSLESPHQFQCWSCKQTGNGYTLLQNYYEESRTLHIQDLKDLVKLKPGTFGTAFRHYKLKKSLDGFIWPVRNSEGNVTALYRYNPSNNQWYSSPKPFSNTLIGQDTLKDTGDIYLVEGHWDAAAFLPYVPDTASLLACCGSSYPSNRLNLLEGRDVIVLFDNDDAGTQGRQRLCMSLKQSGLPTSLKYLDWSTIPDAPDKFDLRDLLNRLKAQN